MTIVITAKTRMGRDVCVGALDLETDRSLRLQRSDGSNQPADCSYEVGQTWEMEYQACANLRPPHIEDVMVLSERLVGRLENARELFSRASTDLEGQTAATVRRLCTVDYQRCGVHLRADWHPRSEYRLVDPLSATGEAETGLDDFLPLPRHERSPSHVRWPSRAD
jgi:hypothetical protein